MEIMGYIFFLLVVAIVVIIILGFELSDKKGIINSYRDDSRKSEQKIAALILEHDVQKREYAKQSVEKSRSVMKGQINEQLAPFHETFQYKSSDCRFIGNPIDYLVIDGLAEDAESFNIVLLDVKTGTSKLTKTQRKIRKAVQEGRVKFEEFRI